MLALALLAVACTRSSAPAARAADDQAVYAVVLDSLYIHAPRPAGSGQVTLVVLAARTRPELATISSAADLARDAPRDLLAAYISASRTNTLLEPPPGFAVPCRILARRMESELFPGSLRLNSRAPDPFAPFVAEWKAFYHRYPGSAGIAALSPVGFDRTRSWALVGFHRTWSFGNSEGYLVLLRRTAAGWRIVRTAMVSVV